MDKPTVMDAEKAINILERAIREDSSNARAPWERNTPDDTPIWKPERWTLRYMPTDRKHTGWIWGMDSSDQQVIAYTWVREGQSTTYVTHHGQERHQVYSALPFHATVTMKDWYSFDVKYRRSVLPASAGGTRK